MPKYYVSCLNLEEVLVSNTPLDACVEVCSKLGIGTAGLMWTVSERGFNSHNDDTLIYDDEINEEFLRRMDNGDPI